MILSSMVQMKNSIVKYLEYEQNPSSSQSQIGSVCTPINYCESEEQLNVRARESVNMMLVTDDTNLFNYQCVQL